MSAGWYLFQDSARSAAENMAVDEALLLSSPSHARPILRFYSWTEPAASFGYFQRYAEIERLTALRPLVRRPTGGGLVPHDADWTYSVVFPLANPWYVLKAIESYRRLHDWVQAAFQACGLAVELAPTTEKTAVGQCFAGPEQFDVVWQGRKLAGAAQRRTRSGLLIQGSVQPPAGADRREWQKALCALAARRWGILWETFHPSASLAEQVETLDREKYALPSYNRRR